MYTELGKYLRKMRIERDLLLKDMAETMNITPAYLSSIEHGKREANDNFINVIINAYNLNSSEQKSLINALNISKSQIKLNLKTAKSVEHKELGIVFARKFEGLTYEQIEKLLADLKEDKK